MKNLIQLPKEFEIHKKGFSKKTFLNNATLTNKENGLIVKFVKEMLLLYDIRYHDGSEIILMDVELLYRLNYRTDIDIAKVISTALPYNCITLLRNEEYVRIVVFSKRQNTIQVCRSVLLDQASTNIFDINKPFFGEDITIRELATQLCDISSTANNVIDRCINIIGNNKTTFFGDEVENYKSDRKLLEEIKAGMEDGFDPESERIEYTAYSYDDYGTDEDYDLALERNWYSVYDYDEELEILSKEETLCDCAYTFYIESNSEISELDWLLQYAGCCAEVMSRLYSNYNMKSDFYRKLGAAFSKKMEVNLKEYSHAMELELLQEILYEEYTC